MNGDGATGHEGDPLKNPPSWSAEGEGRYPFEKYEQDMRLWIAATSLAPGQIGPAIALRLQGTARELARACDPSDLINGRTEIDITTGQPTHIAGYELLLQALKKKDSVHLIKNNKLLAFRSCLASGESQERLLMN